MSLLQPINVGPNNLFCDILSVIISQFWRCCLTTQLLSHPKWKIHCFHWQDQRDDTRNVWLLEVNNFLVKCRPVKSTRKTEMRERTLPGTLVLESGHCLPAEGAHVVRLLRELFLASLCVSWSVVQRIPPSTRPREGWNCSKARGTFYLIWIPWRKSGVLNSY